MWKNYKSNIYMAELEYCQGHCLHTLSVILSRVSSVNDEKVFTAEKRRKKWREEKDNAFQCALQLI